jgi:tetratricopeptide (TPR) repeat protein
VNRTMIPALLVVLALVGCRQDRGMGDQRTETMTPQTMEQARANWPAGLAELIDSANAAYSAREYDEAARLYRQSAELAPTVTATWFGIYMAEHARGNIAAADSAMARAQALAPDASLIHGAPGDTLPAGPLPPGHP